MSRDTGPRYIRDRLSRGGLWCGSESALPPLSRCHALCGYYRTRGGTEIDLVLDLGGGELWAIEVSLSSAPSVSRGFYTACEDLRPARKFVVHPGEESFPLRHGVEAVTLKEIMNRLG